MVCGSTDQDGRAINVFDIKVFLGLTSTCLICFHYRPVVTPWRSHFQGCLPHLLIGKTFLVLPLMNCSVTSSVIKAEKPATERQRRKEARDISLGIMMTDGGDPGDKI